MTEKNYNLTIDQIENCRDRSKATRLVETDNSDGRSGATQALEIDNSDDRSTETQQEEKTLKSNKKGHWVSTAVE